MYNVIPYKSKLMHVEYGILKVSFIKRNRNADPRKENRCGDDSSMVLLYVEHLGDTIISGNTDLRGNIILEIRGLVLSSLHIFLHTGDAKYMI